MPEPCNYIYRLLGAMTIWDSGEFCEEDAVEGQDFCAEHGRLADG